MSSLSGAQYNPDLPAQNAGAAGAASAGSLRESALLRRAQNGDRAAYGQIVIVYQDRLYNAVLRIVGDADEAAEVTQDAFMRGLSKLEGFRGDAGPYTWLFRIAVNLAISSVRKNRRRRSFSLEACHDGSSGDGNGSARRESPDQAAGLIDRTGRDTADQPLETLEKRERDQKVVEALGRVDCEYRAMLVMRDIEGFDYQQMADLLDLPLGTLKSRLFRARLALRDQLKAYLADGRNR